MCSLCFISFFTYHMFPSYNIQGYHANRLGKSTISIKNATFNIHARMDLKQHLSAVDRCAMHYATKATKEMQNNFKNE